ncbi:MAG: nickel-dependent hydrogenase large subunit [Candidatus Diapherotrites archaeon]|nr:nickel-dependent hydrogenase large subunit [Candidatus Diapherotrites archaeon]
MAEKETMRHGKQRLDTGAGRGDEETMQHAKGGTSFTISIGPVHPALKEPIQLDFEIEGEKVKNADLRLSQAHRGIEWIGTNRNPIQILYLAERICGICNVCHTLSFCRAVESIANIEVPPRAQYIRTVTAELERIHSHMLWAGVAAHELGFDSVMHYTWRAREKVLDTIEILTGNRVTKGMPTIGGVRRDFPEKHHKRILETVGFYKSIFGKLQDMLLHDPVIEARTRGIGVLKKEEALALCAVGPTARASGVKRDVRQDEPYAAYCDLGVRAITPKEVLGEVHGDVFDRIAVRLAEVAQSADIIEHCVRNIPEGKIVFEEKPIKVLAQLRGAQGEGIGRLEAPRGEVFHYVKMTGQEAPYAWKVKAPTYSNLLSILPMMREAQIADIPIIAASIDP